MNKRTFTFIIISALLLSCPGTLFAKQDGANNNADNNAEPTVEEIVSNTNRVSYYQGKDGRARVKMNIFDSQDRQRNREMTILRWDAPDPELTKEQLEKGKNNDDYCGQQKIYAFFHRPADVYETVFMVWKHLDKDDDRWMYLPALDLVKRISATDKRTSFVGSHFYYEDVSGRNINDDIHELIETTNNYYILKNTPKDDSLVEFKYFKMYIHKESFIVVKTDYYDQNDEVYRTYEALAVEDIDGFQTVTKSKMTDHRTDGYTVLEYSDVEYNLDIPESIFTERYLRRTPRQYIRAGR